MTITLGRSNNKTMFSTVSFENKPDKFEMMYLIFELERLRQQLMEEYKHEYRT